MTEPDSANDKTRVATPRSATEPVDSSRTAQWAAALSATSLEQPKTLGGFEIRGVLGKGAFGQVFRGYDPDLHREVAIKIPIGNMTAELRERLLREARAAANINHPCVCPIHAVGTEGELPFIVMHLGPGTTLAKVLGKRETPFSSQQAASIVRKLAQGVAAAHAIGVVHRDLKPQNVLMEEGSRKVLITDFGLACFAGESHMTAEGTVLGTPAYMSPEQARGEMDLVGPLSDVYALGVILYHLLTGTVPFRGTVREVMAQVERAIPKPPSTLRSGISRTLETICLKAMAKDPRNRFQSAKELAAALGEYRRKATSDEEREPLAEALIDPNQGAPVPEANSSIDRVYAHARDSSLRDIPSAGSGTSHRSGHSSRSANAPGTLSGITSTTLLERDTAFERIVQTVADGSRFVVIAGPAGCGKTATACEFARWHPLFGADAKTKAVYIDAREEFYSLSLVEAVGKAYPEELYAVREGSRFELLSVTRQRQLAIEILASHKATVIFDGPGEAIYPRDSAAEIALARETATDLAQQGVLAIVATRHDAIWADRNPIVLQGLDEKASRGLLERELASRSPPQTLAEFTPKFGGEAAVSALLKRGNPGELLRAARGLAAPDDSPGALSRLFAPIRNALELVFGDPILPQPAAARATGPGPLFVAAFGMMLIAVLALVWSYDSGSQMWERMFYSLARRETDVPPLPARAIKVSPGPGQLVEIARAAIVILLIFLVVIGKFFGTELLALIPYAPWSKVGPRKLGLRSLFRVMFLALGAWLAFSTLHHHLGAGPRTLWVCNGNPFLQKVLQDSDPAKLEELRNLPDSSREKMNPEPPEAGEAGYEEYRRQCAVPYLRYFPYSLMMFVLVGPIVLITGFYAVCTSLWNHLNVQPKRIESLPDGTPPAAVEGRFRFYQQTYKRNIVNYLLLLLVLFGAWNFHLWVDRYNLTETADDHTTRIIIVAVISWIGLFSALVLAYQVLVREAAERIPEGEARDEFERRYGVFRYFLKEVGRSAYSWLCLLPLAGAALWYLLSSLGVLQR